MKTVRIIIVLLAVIAAAAIGAWWYFSPGASRVTMQEARIKDITPMLQLCSVEIYDDVPIKANIGPRHIFAKTSLNGSISFDLENIEMAESGDTLNVILPREIVEIHESTDPGSYMVIDTWNDNFLGSGNFTTAEENAMKAKVRDNYRKSIYAKGYVERARKEAVANLTALLGGLTSKTVIVTDPTPKGTR